MNKIKSLRKLKNLTLEEISIKSGIAKSYLSQLENGILDNPTIKIVKKISDALNLPVSYLIEENMENTEKIFEDSFFIEFNKLNEKDKKRIKDIVSLWINN